MNSTEQVLDSLADGLQRLWDGAAAALFAVEYWLRDIMTDMGIGFQVQTLVMIAAVLLLALGALRIAGGIVRLLLAVGLLAIVAQALLARY